MMNTFVVYVDLGAPHLLTVPHICLGLADVGGEPKNDSEREFRRVAANESSPDEYLPPRSGE